MESNTNILCKGCLSQDRKITNIRPAAVEHCFSLILQELEPPYNETENAYLCWECEARIRNFVKFKEQVRQSYKLLKERVNTVPLSSLAIKNILEINKYINFELEEIPIESQEIHSNADNLDDISEDTSFIHNTKDKMHKKKSSKKLKRVKIDLRKVKIVRLKKEEVLEERRKMESSQDYVNAMFRCERCIISFPNEDDLKEHVHKRHTLNASKFECTICGCTFSSVVSLEYHMTSSHMVRYQCKICGERTQNKRAATKHRAHCYGETYDYVLETKKEAEGDLSENNGVNKDGYSCELCDKVFRWKTSLRKHVEMHQIEAGQKRRPYCEPCGLTFTTTANLQRHAKTSSKHQIKLKLRKLKETNANDKMEEVLSDIKVSILSNKELFSCPRCDKKFEWRGNMIRHLQTHVTKAKGELVCKPCNRTFSSKATYKQHLQISKKHVSENDFKYMCSDCGKRYPNKWKLREHVNWEHLKNYVYSCNDCQKVFSCNTSLYLHKQIVHKPNEYLCDLCGKSFPNKAKLKSHITALHSKDGQFKCKSCSARFNWQSCLSRHEKRMHSKR